MLSLYVGSFITSGSQRCCLLNEVRMPILHTAAAPKTIWEYDWASHTKTILLIHVKYCILAI